MVGYMIEWLPEGREWRRVGGMFLDRREAELALDVLNYTTDKHRVVEVRIYGEGSTDAYRELQPAG